MSPIPGIAATVDRDPDLTSHPAIVYYDDLHLDGLLYRFETSDAYPKLVPGRIEPCTFDEPTEVFTCPGWGTVQGYGRVTSSIAFDFLNGTTTRTLTFGDGSTLVLAEEWDGPFFNPGNSHDAPGQLVSFGNPGFDSGVWEVIGGSGQFATASGSGRGQNVQAGDAIVLKFVGDLTL